MHRADAADVRLLRGGTIDAPITLGGPRAARPRAVLACPDGRYAASTDEPARATIVQRFGNGEPDQISIPSTSEIGLACLTSGISLSIMGTGVFGLTLPSSSAPVRQVPGAPSGLVFGGPTTAWLLTIDDRTGDLQVRVLDQRGRLSVGLPTAIADKGSSAMLAATDASRIWVVTIDQHNTGQYVITELVAG